MSRKQTWQGLVKRLTVCEHGESCNKCCWLWTGAKDRHGYGNASLDGKDVIVHRAIYCGYYNVILTPIQLVLHTCDTKLCCNHWHLYIGDKRRNALDAVARGQYKTGQYHANAVLTASQVYQIRRLYHSGSWTITDLTAIVPVKRSVIQRILTRQDWSHLQGELIRAR